MRYLLTAFAVNPGHVVKNPLVMASVQVRFVGLNAAK